MLTCSVFALFGGGCGGEEEKKSIAPVVQERPKAPPKPPTTPVDKLVNTLSIDDRIFLDENEAPRLESQRVAVLKFFNAMLQADAGTIKSMVSFNDQLELDAMIDHGLASAMDEVSLVVLKTGENQDGRPCVMAIYEIDLDYQVQLWYIDDAGNSATFTSVETPPNLVDQLSGNWIEEYFILKNKQAEIAQMPDEDTSYTLAGELTTSDGSRGSNEPSGPSPGGPGPSGPGPAGRP